jgi:hypothetical protein
MNNLIELDTARPHYITYIQCKLCGCEWIAVYTEKTKALECPGCHEFVNTYGTGVSKHVCETCGSDFTVCPPATNPENWRNCMADGCASYDPSRDPFSPAYAGTVIVKEDL